MKETTQTTLPITILTDYEHTNGNEFEKTRQQIELSGLYLQSIFNTIKRSALFLDGEFAHDESDTVRNFCGDMIHFSEIGNAMLMSVWKTVSDMERNETETLAEKIPFLITNDGVPAEIKESLEQGVIDMVNKIKGDRVRSVENSAEYIEKMLRLYKSDD